MSRQLAPPARAAVRGTGGGGGGGGGGDDDDPFRAPAPAQPAGVVNNPLLAASPSHAPRTLPPSRPAVVAFETEEDDGGLGRLRSGPLSSAAAGGGGAASAAAAAAASTRAGLWRSLGGRLFGGGGAAGGRGSFERVPSSAPRLGGNNGGERGAEEEEEEEEEDDGGNGGGNGGGGRRWCPEAQASLLGRLLFTHVSPLVSLSARKPLEADDLPSLAPGDGARDASAALAEAWGRSGGSLPRAVLRVHGRTLLWTAALKVVHDGVMFASPWLLRQLLSHLHAADAVEVVTTTKTGSSSSSSVSATPSGPLAPPAPDGNSRAVALGWASLLLLSGTLEVLTINVYFEALFRVSLRLKASLTALLYDKSLRLSASAKGRLGVGAVANLQSNDAAKLWALPTYGHMAWNAPFQITVVMSMLVSVLGPWPALAGMLVTVAMVPPTAAFGKALAAVRRRMVEQTDARVKLEAEVVTGVRVIKICAYEQAYARRIDALREEELRSVRRSAMLSLCNSVMVSSAPVLVAIAAFGVFAARGGALTADVAFPALALFNLLRFPLVMLPTQMANLVAAHVAVGRLAGFLGEDEAEAPARLPAARGRRGQRRAAARRRRRREQLQQQQQQPVAAALTAEEQDALEEEERRWQQAAAAAEGKEEEEDAIVVSGADFFFGRGGCSGEEEDDEARGAAPGGQNHHLHVALASPDAATDASSAFALRDVRLSVPAGSLVVVVGPVGSGKSALLLALLGEMHARPSLASASSSASASIPPSSSSPALHLTTVRGSVSYTQQDPYILNATVRENVLMGLPLDPKRYARALAAAALAPDLARLPGGDQAEIGEKGVNLSGGQRHRVALARAAYARADVALLDDPLSAVDAHVGRHLFFRCLEGADMLAAGKTVVLATHQAQWAREADLVVVMRAGRVEHCCPPAELEARGVVLESLELAGAPGAAAGGAKEGGGGEREGEEVEGLQQDDDDNEDDDGGEGEDDAGDDADPLGGGGDQRRRPAAAASAGDASPSPPSGGKAGAAAPPPIAAAKGTDAAAVTKGDASAAAASAAAAAAQAATQAGRLVRAEAREVGSVRRAVYAAYFGAWGPRCALPLALAAAALSERGLQVLQNVVLAGWSNDTGRAQAQAAASAATAASAAALPPPPPPPLAFSNGTAAALSANITTTTTNNNNNTTPLSAAATERFLGAYLALGLVSVAVGLARAGVLVAGATAAARLLHARLLRKVLRLPMAFFDRTPQGRLLNRFSKDTEAADTQLPGVVNSALTCAVSAGFSVAVVVGAAPAAALALLPLAFLYVRLQRAYVGCSREVKRVDSISQSPVFSHFAETLQGLVTIRAYRRERAFARKDLVLLDGAARPWWQIQSLNRWLSVRLEMMGNLVVFAAAAAVGALQQRSPGMAGLGVSSAMALTGTVSWLLRQISELEIQMNAVERLVEWETESEEAPTTRAPGSPPLPVGWPSVGRLEVEALVVRYRPELPPVLKGVSFAVEGGQKCGVVGRTGCGKSTLVLALLRLVEPDWRRVGGGGAGGPEAGSRVRLDGVDASRVGLRDLRRAVSLVPQDPTVFSGTIRSNLDPFGEARSDADVWESLARAGLDAHVRALPGGLDAPVREGGSNFSGGQRQLLAMARALLRRSKVLILDEATSSVSAAEDALIQRSLRSAFASATVLTIAHRLGTILDYDLALVLEHGRVAEFAPPAELAAKPNGVFAGMIQASRARQQQQRARRRESIEAPPP